MLHVFIINPRWGRKHAGGLIGGLEAALRERKLDYRLAISEQPGHATELAHRAVAEGAGAVVAVGGDGTVNEVLNGLSGNAMLGVVPVGTCNDIARNLRLPAGDWRAALDVIAAGHVKCVDVARCGDKRFLSVAGMGLDSRVAVAFQRLPRFARFRATYVLLLLKSLLTQRPSPFRLVVDGETLEQEAWLVAVANTEAYGGGMRIAPGARPDDGRLHVCIVGAIPRLEFVRWFPRVYRGAHLAHPMFRHIEARSVEISSPRPTPITADGEPFGWLPASIILEPKAVAVFGSPGRTTE
jgi:diacylglycerol kinase (ATP)